jgi:hypothetical protein
MIHGKEVSGVSEIGKMLAKELCIDYIDNRIIAHIARRLNRHVLDVAKKEISSRTLLGRIAGVLSLGENSYSKDYQSGDGEIFYVPMELYPWEILIDDKLYLQTLKVVITELAKSHAIVIRGRGSQFILKNFPGAYHVLIVAPTCLRVERTMESLKLDEENAKKQIKNSDNSQREFIRRYFNAETENTLDYGLVINTKDIAFQDAASIIANAIPSESKVKHMAAVLAAQELDYVELASNFACAYC